MALASLPTLVFFQIGRITDQQILGGNSAESVLWHSVKYAMDQ